MAETDDESSYRNSWDPIKDLMLVTSIIQAMPKWNQDTNDKEARDLIREFLRKYSGGIPLKTNSINLAIVTPLFFAPIGQRLYSNLR